ncbi:hypothetical protein [Tenacibaculum soleae]|uniref:hypothetical protein n=1 Tax=Tenacibaculum soleae TaxID=447689 RepID=UPI002300A5AE|nr:hypothetical protein [Tenacibaculum soleae]
MNKYYKIGIAILIGIIGYLIGNYLPFEMFKPEFSNNNLSKGEYYRLIISVFSAIITFCAVFVALFKDDIREQWKRPRIEFCTPTEITVEDLAASLDSESGNDTVKANKYLSRVEVINKGNLPALNAEIYLDKLEFTPKDSEIKQYIESSSSALDWNGTDSLTIIIPPGGKKLINIVEITPPEIISTPDSEKTKRASNLIIGNIINKKDQTKGKWTATFSLYAQNHKPTNFTVEIIWSGLWKNRLTEFNNQYQINKKA